MAPSSNETLNPLSKDLVNTLGAIAGKHAGFRPVHAKGIMFSGVFTPGERGRFVDSEHRIFIVRLPRSRSVFRTPPVSRLFRITIQTVPALEGSPFDSTLKSTFTPTSSRTR